MSRPSGLGRGLNALIPAPTSGRSGLMTLPLASVSPNRRQPRGSFDQARLDELARSLRQVGMLQPILVRPAADGRYEIIAGERRFRAAKIAGLHEIPVIVRHADDTQMLTEAVVENIHRADLNPLEEAAAFRQLLDDLGMTHEELAHRLGKSRSSITNALRLLTLPAELQRLVAEGTLSSGHARALLAAQPPALQQQLAQRVAVESLSVRATEDLVRSATDASAASPAGDRGRQRRHRQAGALAHLQRRLTDALATRVQITGSPRRGRVVIDFSGEEDLERILVILGRGAGQDLTHEEP